MLVIHLKRFEANGRFSDKVDTFVDFPLKALDLTPLMPGGALGGAPVGGPNGVNGAPAAASLAPEDPRTQAPPFKYDLYGVTNHYGYLSSGHCEFLCSALLLLTHSRCGHNICGHCNLC